MNRRIVAAVLLCGVAASAWTLSAEEIIDRMERNVVFDTVRSEGSMTVKDRFGTKRSTFRSSAKGSDLSLIEFTSVEEQGMKVLRTKDEIYLYYPDAAELIRLQGAALRDSVMGSDMSYEDMTGGKELLKSYKVQLAGTETVGGAECYRIEMEARRRDVPYFRQTVWVDSKLFIYRRVHKYSRSGTLLKEVEVDELRQVAGYNVATRMTLRDTLKKSSSTEFAMDRIEIDVPLDPRTFSLGTLTW